MNNKYIIQIYRKINNQVKKTNFNDLIPMNNTFFYSIYCDAIIGKRYNEHLFLNNKYFKNREKLLENRTLIDCSCIKRKLFKNELIIERHKK